jgi:ADP-heptose:LPS heptosyltransferase
LKNTADLERMNTHDNILLIRLKSIGDILLTLPAVHVVREHFPDAKLHFLVSQEHAPILRGFADVDEVIPLNRSIYRARNLPAAGAATARLLLRLRRLNFSRAIDFHGYGETELLSWWSGAPERWGCVYRPLRGWTYTRGIPRRGGIHAAEGHLSMLNQCGLTFGEVRNEYSLPRDAQDAAANFFAEHHLDPSRRTLFIQPFTSTPEKNWPLEKYLALAEHGRSRGWQVLFGGGSSERAALEPALAAGFVVCAGTPLLVAAGLMKRSALVVGADTGLLHLAVAMGQRVIMIMVSNTAGAAHPFRHPDWTVTPPPGKTVWGIPTAMVIEACDRALDETEIRRFA